MADGSGDGSTQKESSPAGGIDIGKLLAGGFTVVSTLIAIVGSITGAASRFLRNNPGALIAAVALSVFAVGVSLAGSHWGSSASGKHAGRKKISAENLSTAATGGADASSAFTSTPDAAATGASTPDTNGHDASPARADQQSRLFRLVTTLVTKFATAISFFLFAAAALVTVIFLTQSLASSDRPRITSTWYQMGSQAILSVTVKLSEMKIGDTLNVSVRPVNVSDTGEDWTVGPVVYASQTGADAAGDGDLTFNVPLPTNYEGLRVVANLGTASVTCNGLQMLTPASPSPTPIPSSSTPVPVITSENNQLTPIFSCVTEIAPVISPTPSPSPSSSR
jgi:hypothetical protein